MASKGLLAVALLGCRPHAGWCLQSTMEPASEANLTPRDKKLLAAAPYENVTIPEPYRRHIVAYHRKEQPGTIVIDSDARYLYYVLADGQAIRYGRHRRRRGLVVVGRGESRPHDRMADLDADRRDQEAHGRARLRRLRTAKSDGRARAMYLFDGNKDTMYRIHGTNQPEYIGQAISSGCIRMTNEDVIDLYKRVSKAPVVVVLAPHQGDSPYSPRVASSGNLFQR